MFNEIGGRESRSESLFITTDSHGGKINQEIAGIGAHIFHILDHRLLTIILTFL